MNIIIYSFEHISKILNTLSRKALFNLTNKLFLLIICFNKKFSNIH